MKTITIRELHARTGRWVREVARYGQIIVTDSGQPVARLVPEHQAADVPYFAQRKRSAKFKKLDESGKMGRGVDATRAVSEDRDERG